MAGSDIISAIESGLGLMADIVGEFNNGFTQLIWVPAVSSGGTTVPAHLTTFGTFALVFLGIAITFAVVKLALNLIRVKTGA